MTSHRFRFIGEKRDSHWVLNPDEHHHIKRVLKLSTGTPIEACDGQGRWAIGHLEKLNNELILSPEEEHFSPRPTQEIHLAIAALQPKTFLEIIPGLTEVGVDNIHLFLSEGTNKSFLNQRHLEKWQKTSLAAIKQCKRAYAVKFRMYNSLQGFFNEVRLDEFAGKYLLSEKTDESSQLSLNKSNTMALLGNEAGLSNSEEELATKHGFIPVSINANVLRAKTCALGIGFLLSYERLISSQS